MLRAMIKNGVWCSFLDNLNDDLYGTIIIMIIELYRVLVNGVGSVWDGRVGVASAFEAVHGGRDTHGAEQQLGRVATPLHSRLIRYCFPHTLPAESQTPLLARVGLG